LSGPFQSLSRIGARPGVVAALTGLAVAAAVPPIALAVAALSGFLPWSPLTAGGVFALLVLSPASFGAIGGRTGARRLAGLIGQSREAELAVLRVMAMALLFAAALAIAVVLSRPASGSDAVPVATAAVVGAWAILACVLRWPVAPSLRRSAATALDIALFSAMLHYGGAAFAGFYPVYDLLILYIGLRFGPPALLDAALFAMLGFSAVILTTETWQQEPALAIGLLLALAALPACFAGTLNALGVARVRAARAESARQSTLQLIADTLRSPPDPARTSEAAMPLADIVDLAALEAGTFAPPIESFEPRALVKRALIAAQRTAAAKGVALHWRIDARLPHRLRGQAQALSRILAGLADHAIEAAPGRPVCLTVEGAALAAAQVELRLRVDGLGPGRETGLATDDVPLSLRIVERLVALVGGTFLIDRQARERVRLLITLLLAVEEGAAPPAPDLAGRSVLIATEDGDLARILAEALAQWNADPCWPDDIAAALNDLSRLWQTRRRVLIVDGRDRLLSALSLSHDAARLGADAPYIILVAEENQLAGLADVDQGEIAGFIPAPVTAALLANALDALPLDADRSAPARPAAPPPAIERPSPLAPLAKSEPAPIAAVDLKAIDGLRALGDDPGFLGDLIESFETDARRIMERLDEAAAAGDAAAFAQSLAALRRAASPLGGTQLCELAATLQGLGGGELRQRGRAHVQRLDGELARLIAALSQLRPASLRLQ
jgi:signal transduction histidine kinase/HPt (histidine-containing phosphotransfer) domain-containing protein